MISRGGFAAGLTGNVGGGDLLNGGGATLLLGLVEGSGTDGNDLDAVLGARLDLEDGVTGVDGAGEGVLALEGDDVGDLKCKPGARAEFGFSLREPTRAAKR